MGDFREWWGGVGEFVFVVDVAVGVFGAHGGGLVGEPFLAGGGGVGGWVGGVAVGEFGGGPVGVDAGHRGVRPVQCPHLVDLGELLDLGVEEIGQRGRVGGFLLQPVPGVGVGGGVGFGGAQRRGLPVSGGGLGGAGELVDHPGGAQACSRSQARMRIRSCPSLMLHFVGVGVGAAQRAPGGAVGGVGLQLARVWVAGRSG